MRVLHLSDTFSALHMDSSCRLLAAQLAGLRRVAPGEVEVELVSRCPTPTEPDPEGCRWYRRDAAKGGAEPGLAWLLRQRLRAFRPDLLHIHHPRMAVLAAVAAPRRLPTVYQFHRFWHEADDRNGLLRGLFTAAERWALRQMNHHIALSQYARARLLETVPDAAITIIPGSLDTRLWQQRQAVAAEAAEYRFIAVRRLEPRTGVDRLLRAFGRLAEGRRKCRLTIVGAGSEAARLQVLAEEAGCADRVTFAGRVDDDGMREAVAGHDCLVVPTVQHEGWGMSVIEALSLGVPVVTTPVGGLREFAAHGDVCHLCSGTTVAELLCGLRWALEQFTPSLELAERCHRVAADRYDIRPAATRLLDLYRSVIAR